ncbi:glucose-6-phosphate isomerase family protein [Halanaerobium salsuginis]|uniref:glucose-6-phosphate isomerase n=1 Tax=Halanaerobium salsuginis TaxID=29563 RepID=A0A1I4JA36_9FIRM|nr:glucose-6-phosphate isomerase family protein [Halanaerobium salsuginis]SFL63043.1 glucose-6-phosphate isomerase [Halanaerobium salsuginis]
MNYESGLNIKLTDDPIGFEYLEDLFGPEVENRKLDDIRQSLKNPDCNGPDVVYSIAMDVGKKIHLKDLKKRNLLFGIVRFAAGRLGDEPVRSQGHIHALSASCNMSTPEVYEIWSGEAIIYMQETALDDPGRCFAVKCKPGEVVIVPPGWAHSTISSNPANPLTFGAWCVRDYGFEYNAVREHNGLAFFPILDKKNNIIWQKNDCYQNSNLIIKSPNKYKAFAIKENIPIYTQYEKNNDLFMFVADPTLKKDEWNDFIP